MLVRFCYVVSICSKCIKAVSDFNSVKVLKIAIVFKVRPIESVTLKIFGGEADLRKLRLILAVRTR